MSTLGAVGALLVAPPVLACSDEDDGGGSAATTRDTTSQASDDGTTRDDDATQDGGATRDDGAPQDDQAAGGSGRREGSAPAGSGPSSSAGAVLGGEREEAAKAATAIGQVYDTIRDVPRTGRKELAPNGGGELCDIMTEEAQEQTIDYAQRTSGRKETWDCEKAVGLLIGRSQRAGTFDRSAKARVVGVTADGDKATASIRFGDRGAVSTVPLVRVDGEWKIGVNPVGGE
jgi:hypothetical protein